MPACSDPDRLRALLNTDRPWALYPLGDLEPHLWVHCECWCNHSAVTLLYRRFATPVLLAFGIWAGYRTAQSGGNLGHVILAGVILGILPVILDIGGFGIILGRGVQEGMLAGVFGFAMILFGSLTGGGFALSK